MSSKFSDQSNFLIAFIAAAIGLFIFREELESLNIAVFGLDIPVFYALLVFIGIMSLSAYISALALISGNLNVTAFPLTKYLEKAATFVGVFGLLYPLIAVFLYGVSFLIMHFGLPRATDLVSTISLIVGLATGLVGAFTIGRNKRLKDIQDKYLSITRDYKDNIILSAANESYSFLEHYEYVTGYAREYLRTLGYGVRTNSLSFIFEKLVGKNEATKDELKLAQQINKARNMYAHGQQKLTKKELGDLEKSLDLLYTKLYVKFTKIVSEEES